LRRIHRTFLERVGYMAIYRCKSCQEEQAMPRRWRYHLGSEVRCPQCGTERLTKLKSPDRIDPMQTGFLNLLERLLDGKLYHCRFCRIQFYDRRGSAPVREHLTETAAEAESAESRGRTA
jgi:DNA-directed RNA polymerase subunit RPC12/RpoP